MNLFSERRQAEAARIREKYPDRIPVINLILCFYLYAYMYRFVLFFHSCSALQVIVEKAERSDIPDIDKKKFVTVLLFMILI